MHLGLLATELAPASSFFPFPSHSTRRSARRTRHQPRSRYHTGGSCESGLRSQPEKTAGEDGRGAARRRRGLPSPFLASVCLYAQRCRGCALNVATVHGVGTDSVQPALSTLPTITTPRRSSERPQSWGLVRYSASESGQHQATAPERVAQHTRYAVSMQLLVHGTESSGRYPTAWARGCCFGAWFVPRSREENLVEPGTEVARMTERSSCSTGSKHQRQYQQQ